MNSLINTGIPFTPFDATTILPPGSTSADLQTAINGATSGDVIELSSDMTFLSAVTIPAALAITIQSSIGDNWVMTQTETERHFLVSGTLVLSYVTVNGDVTGAQTETQGGLDATGNITLMNGVIIEHCYSNLGGAISLNGGVLSIQDGSIRNNYSSSGGGVYINNGGTLNMSGGSISSNTAQNLGGGVCVDNGGEMYLLEGVIEDNHVMTDSGNGGGVTVNDGGYFEMSGGSITRNTLNLAANQGGIGGGVSVDRGEFQMTNGTISYNKSKQYGAGVGVTNNGTFSMSDGSIVYNTAQIPGGGTLSGGGVAVNYGLFTMSGGVISHNEAYYGGGVYLGYGALICRLDMTGGIVEENYASGFGGGIRAQNATSTVKIGDAANRSSVPTIQNNRSGDYGGGISLNGSTLNMYNGAVYNNSARYGGGISVLSDAVCDISDGEIYQNQASDAGGGIYILSGSNAIIANATIRGNTAGSNGGGMYVDASATLAVTGASAITNNSAPNGAGGGIYTEDYSYSNPADTSAYVNISTAGTTVFSGNTALSPYVPPSNASDFTNIGYETTSLTTSTGYLHPLNNYDINYEGGTIFIQYSVTYNANGATRGSVPVDPNSPYLVGDRVTVLGNEGGLTRVGYTFVGWTMNPDGSGTVYQAGDTFIMPGNDVILYARWEPVTPPCCFKCCCTCCRCKCKCCCPNASSLDFSCSSPWVKPNRRR